MLHRLRELARADNLQTGGRTTLKATLAQLRADLPGLVITAEGGPALARPIAMSGENALIVLSHRQRAGRHGDSQFERSRTGKRMTSAL